MLFLLFQSTDKSRKYLELSDDYQPPKCGEDIHQKHHVQSNSWRVQILLQVFNMIPTIITVTFSLHEGQGLLTTTHRLHP